MENKMLSIQSFYRNQNILNALNRLLIYLKLERRGINSKISEGEVAQSKEIIAQFLTRLDKLVESVEKTPFEPLIGADQRMRSFAKNFIAAKQRKNRFKSVLFKKDISGLGEMLLDINDSNIETVIDSLSELSSLLEEQTSFDAKEIVGEI